MKKTKSIAIILTATFLTAACSGGDVLVFDTRLGPVTKSQIKALPGGLVGDKTNARHTTYTLEGEGMKDEDGK